MRPFRVLGVQQIALGAPRKADLTTLWNDLLGLERVGTYESKTENVAEDILRLGSGPHAVEIDLMEALDPERKPRPDTPALNHVGLWVDDIDAAFQWLGDRGVRFAPGGIRPGASGHRVCFIHPRPSESHPVSGHGALIELVQAPPDVIAALGSGE
jgi:lactoylglutathione lyase